MMTSRTTTALASKAPSAFKAKGGRLALALATAISPVWALAQDLPTGGNVVHGTATINTPTANTMIINQGSDRAVVNWDGFSVGAGNRVDINQPTANSAILNRVTGDATSQIHGQINANGRVFVVNPNGIFIGQTGTVNTGGFVASTLGIRTDDFVMGTTVFEGNGASATVENAGSIQVVTGGYAALIGGKVKNSGTIQAPLGFVGLGSGERITLDLAGNGFLQVALPTNSGDDGLDALIENSGTIQANGGTVQISAATARNAARHAINMSGVVEARTVSGRNGSVTLGGGGGGKVTVTGKVRTSARRSAIQVTQSARPTPRPERGGDITITGRDIDIAGASIDASGIDSGGNIRIGGNQSGAPGLPTAETLTVDQDTTIVADALTQGDGGRVILWSDDRTEFGGKITARGGSEGGDGGFIEVSGKQTLRFSGLADTTAENGEWGTLLLDPDDIFIVAALTGNDGDILASDIETLLAVNNAVVIQSTAGPGPDEGRIEVNAPLTWTTNATLSLIADIDPFFGPTAGDAIVINAPITATNGHLLLTAFADPGSGPIESRTISTGVNGNINVGLFELAVGNWTQVGVLPTFTATNFVIDAAGDNSFLRATSGDGGTNPYLLTDVYGLQGVGTIVGPNNFNLANDIDAAITSSWVSLDLPTNGVNDAGFVPLDYSGILVGERYKIENLFVRRHSNTLGSSNAGLFSSISGSVQDLTIENADIAGQNAGILAAENLSGVIAGVSVSGTIQAYTTAGAGTIAGGVIGDNDDGTFFGVAADVTIFDVQDPSQMLPGNAEGLLIGGIVGRNGGVGDLNQVKSSGNLTYDNSLVGRIGGIAGQNNGIIQNAYSTATVTADSTLGIEGYAGTIAGDNTDLVLNSLANGVVTLTGAGFAGTVVGIDDTAVTSIASSYYNSDLNGLLGSGQSGEMDSGAPGPFQGARAQTTAQLLDSEAFYLEANPAGWDFDAVWAPPQDGVDQARIYSIDPVIFAQPVFPIPQFQYNGAVTGQNSLATFVGGPNIFLFGPAGDTGNVADLSGQITLSDPNVGLVDFTYPTSFTSDLGQLFDVRSFEQPAQVNPAPLFVTVGNTTKPYGTELAFSAVPLTAGSLFGSDTITGGDIVSAGAPAAATADGNPYALSVANLTGPGLTNYNIISIVPGELTITQRGVNIIINDATKTYGEQLLFTGNEFTTVGLVNGDTISSLTITSDGAAPEAQVSDGPFAINGVDPVGSGAQNYTLTITPGTMIIEPAPLTITADDQTKTFGNEFTFNGDEFAVEGLLNADEVTAATLASDATAVNAALTGEGGAALFITDPTGTGLDNYEITLVNGVFVVAPGNLTITANDQTKVYGSGFVFDGTEFTVVGLAEGDSVDTVTLASAAADANAQVGDSPFAIAASDAMGTGLEKYTLIFADGTFFVTPAPLTVTALDQTKQQGQLFTFNGTEFATTGLFNSDAVISVELSSDGAAIEALADDSPFDIIAGDISGTGLDNYIVTTANGVFTIENQIVPPIINPVPGGNRSIANPPDNISISFPGEGGTSEIGAIQEEGGSGGGSTQSLPAAKETLAVVDTVSESLEAQVGSCGSSDQDFSNYMTCLSASLDTYSNALDQIVNDLPQGLETVSATIRTASDEVKAAAARAQRRLATATTDAQRNAIRRDAVEEARGAIDNAKSEIRKAITLIRADDPEVSSVQRDAGARIIQAFDTVESSLVKAVEL